MKSYSILSKSISSLLLIGTLGATQATHAANIWDGGGAADNWSDLQNWDNDLFPGYGTLTFAGATRTTNIVDASISMNQLIWTGTSSWTLNNSGGALISLYDNGGTQAKVENQSTGTVTINAPLSFSANNGTPPNPFGEISAVNGDITFSGGTVTVAGSSVNGLKFWSGAGRTVTFNNTVSAAGKWLATTGSGAITIGATGSVTSADLYIMNGGSLNLAGSLTTDAGKGVRLGGDFGATVSPSTPAGNQDLTKSGTFNLTPASGGLTYAGLVNTVGGNTSGALLIDSQNTSGTNTLSGNIFLDSALKIQQASGGTLSITSGTFDIKAQALRVQGLGDVTISSVISNSIAGGSLVKADAGRLTLSNTNTYTGGTTIGVVQGAAVIRATATQALGTGQITFDGAGNASTARLELTSGISLNNAISLAGRNSNSVAIQNISGSNTLSGTITLNLGGGNYWLQSDTGLLTLSSATAITAASGVRNVTLQGAGNGSITGVVANGGGTVSLTKEGAGVWSLSGVNTFTGGVTLNAGTLNINNNAALGNTATGALTINGGTIDAFTGAITTTAAKAQNWNGDFAYTGTNALSFNGGVVTLGGVGLSRSVTVNGSTLTEGSVSGIGYGLTKAGAGTLVFGTAVSRITGTLNVTGGTFRLGQNDFFATGLTGGGIVELGAGTERWLFIQANADNVFSGTLQNGGASLGLNKAGAGTLTLSGTTTNTGQHTIGGGTIEYGTTALGGTVRSVGGALVFDKGDGAVKSSSDGTGTASVTFAGAESRTAGATGNFIVSGGTNGTTNQIKITKAAGFIDQGTFFNGSSYAWMNALNTYVRGINYATDGVTVATSGATTTMAAIAHQEFTGAISAQATATFTTLKDSGNNNLTLAGGATVTTNGFLKSGNVAGGATISGGTGIQAASGAELVIRTDGGNDALTISTPILANGASSLTKTGAGTLTLSAINTYTGATTVAGGTLNLTGTTNSGSTITVQGGTLNVSGTVTAGASQISVTGASNSVLNILPGASISRANLYVGNNTNGSGAVYQTGGNLTLTQAAGVNNFQLGTAINGYGYYKISGGTLTLNEMGIGGSNAANAYGVMEVTNGGAVADAGWITVARGGGTSSGVLNVDGGTMTVGSRVNINWAGTAGAQSVINVANGSITVANSTTVGLDLANANVAGTLGVVNLLPGGTFTTGVVTSSNANPTALLNFNGGTLRATATNGGAAFMTSGNIDAVTVYSGGGTINNNATNITISRPILAPTGNGVSSIAVSASGSGYIGVPMVVISGGGGTGATANAAIDGNGLLTGITITNPGTGYTSTPVVTLVGGGGTGATIGTVNTAANANSGTLTFTGGGTTTLSGQNSYNGNVLVSNGVLSATVGLIGNPVTSSLGNGTVNGRTITVSPGATLAFTANDIFGNATAVAANLPSLVINGTLSAARYNQIGAVTLNGALLTTANITDSGNYQNFQFLGDVTVGGSTPSTIASTGAANFDGNHLFTSTNFVVADVTGNANTDLTVSSPFRNKSGNYGLGAGALVKSGAGTMALTGTSTYTGTTSVTNGTLLLSGSGSTNSTSGIAINGAAAKLVQTSSTAISPTVTLTSGTVDGTTTINTVNVANLAGNTIANGNGTTSILTIGNLTFGGAGTINVNSAGSEGLAVTSALVTTPANGQVTINVTTAPVWTNGSTYNLIRYGTFGGLTTDFTRGTISGLSGRQSATLGNTGPTTGFITLTIAGDNPVWSGANGGVWTTAVTNSATSGAPNWALRTGHTTTDFWASDAVEFNDTVNINGSTNPPSTTAVSIQGGSVSPVSSTFNNSVVNYTISSTGGFGIASGVLVKNGTASLTIGTANTYTGATSLNDGTTIITGSLGNTAVSVAAPATLTLSAANAISQNTLTVNGTYTQTVDNALSGTAVLVLNNGATIANSNNYNGGTTLSTGTVDLNAASALGTGATILNSGTLNLNGASALGSSPLSINAGNVNIGNASALGTGLLTISGGTIDNSSGGALVLTGSNAEVWTNNATLSFTGTNAVDFGNGAVTLGSNAAVASFTINNGSSLPGTSLTFGGAITPGTGGTPGFKTLNVSGSGSTALTGNITKGTATSLIINDTVSGTLTLSGAASSINLLNVNGGASSIVELGTGNLTLNNGGGSNLQSTTGGTINGTGGGSIVMAAVGGDFGTAGGTTLTVNAKITGTNAVDFWNNNGGAGIGTVVLGGANTYTGATNVQNEKLVVTTGGAINALNTANVGQVTIGDNNVTNALLSVEGGTVNATKTASPSLAVGSVAGAVGAVYMTSGAINTTSELHLGRGLGSYSALTMSAGTVSTGSWLVVGFQNDRAVVNQSGGTINVNNNRLTVGAGGTGSFGVMNMSGTSILNASSGSGGAYIGENGVGVLSVSGTAALNLATNGLRLGQNAGSNGVVNLLGGTITTNFVAQGGGAGIFNFNGGTLKAGATIATFMQGLTAAYVYGGGGTVDTNGFNITIAQSLLKPVDNGVSAQFLTVSGGGYIATPLVQITGGGGTGATAIASIDGSGNLTGITMTNPGTGYTTAPSFTLVGGGIGNTGSLGGFASTVSNTSGSLTKTGNGTLTLSGTQDYDTLHVAAGNLNLDNLLGTGGSTLTVDATTNTNISVSQTLAALNIGDGAVVTLGGPALSPAPSFADLSGGAALGAAAVPEPGSLSLLAMGALAFLRRRRRAQVAIIR